MRDQWARVWQSQIDAIDATDEHMDRTWAAILLLLLYRESQLRLAAVRRASKLPTTDNGRILWRPLGAISRFFRGVQADVQKFIRDSGLDLTGIDVRGGPVIPGRRIPDSVIARAMGQQAAATRAAWERTAAAIATAEKQALAEIATEAATAAGAASAAAEAKKAADAAAAAARAAETATRAGAKADAAASVADSAAAAAEDAAKAASKASKSSPGSAGAKAAGEAANAAADAAATASRDVAVARALADRAAKAAAAEQAKAAEAAKAAGDAAVAAGGDPVATISPGGWVAVILAGGSATATFSAVTSPGPTGRAGTWRLDPKALPDGVEMVLSDFNTTAATLRAAAGATVKPGLYPAGSLRWEGTNAQKPAAASVPVAVRVVAAKSGPAGVAAAAAAETEAAIARALAAEKEADLAAAESAAATAAVSATDDAMAAAEARARAAAVATDESDDFWRSWSDCLFNIARQLISQGNRFTEQMIRTASPRNTIDDLHAAAVGADKRATRASADGTNGWRLNHEHLRLSSVAHIRGLQRSLTVSNGLRSGTDLFRLDVPTSRLGAVGTTGIVGQNLWRVRTLDEWRAIQTRQNAKTISKSSFDTLGLGFGDVAFLVVVPAVLAKAAAEHGQKLRDRWGY